MKLSRFPRAGSAVMVGALALTLAACGSDNPTGETSEPAGGETSLSGEVNGGGASSQESAQAAWMAGFQGLHPDVTVNYDAVGSGGGRDGFIDGSYAFAGSDSALDEEELTAAEAQCGEVIEFPAYISPIAVVFNLEGVESVNMGPETIAKVFAGEITTWDDAEIVEQNPDVDLPSTKITPVHRSDDSGTTENFVEYLSVAAPDVWTYEVEGVWPGEITGGESGAQTAGVVQAVEAGDGTVGYVDASQVGSFGTVAVGVGDEYVPYSPDAAAAVVDGSPRIEGAGETIFAFELARDIPGTYPIVLVSYGLACSTYEDQETADLVKAYWSYIVSADGQAASADAAGSAPISDELSADVTAALDAITVG